MFKGVQKSSIHFRKPKKKKDIEDKYINAETNEEKEEEENEESLEESDEEIVENLNKNINQNNDEQNSENSNEDINQNNKEEENNNMIDLDFLEDKLNKEKDEEIKKLYIYELEQISYDEDIFSNKVLIEMLKDNEFKQNRNHIIDKYKSNFMFIKNKIDWLIQSLIDKIESIPYTVRCICKVIFLLLKKKFPYRKIHI